MRSICCRSLCAHANSPTSLSVNVESEGPYEPERLLPEAIKVMRGKIAAIRKAAEELLVVDDDGLPAGSRPPGGEDVEMGGP